MKRIRITKKQGVLAACIAIPAVLAAIFIPKAVKAKKCGRYATH